jgi:hypothetical protein
MGSLFKVGGPDGPQFKANAGVLEAKSTDDSVFALMRAALIPATGETVNDIVALLDLRGRVAQIEFSFDGGAAPAPGANTGKFGFCHTAGGGYSAGEIVYDDGAALIKIPTVVCKHLTTTSAFSGTISMIANGVYSNDAGTWTLKGDGTATSAGRVLTIAKAFTATTVSSTTAIPAGATVLRTRLVIGTADAAATIKIESDGGVSDEELMATTDNKPSKVGEYHREDTHEIVADTAGVVQITIVGATTLVGKAFVEYTTALA